MEEPILQRLKHFEDNTHPNLEIDTFMKLACISKKTKYVQIHMYNLKISITMPWSVCRNLNILGKMEMKKVRKRFMET